MSKATEDLSEIVSKYRTDSWPLEISFDATFADPIDEGGVSSLGSLKGLQEQWEEKKAGRMGSERGKEKVRGPGTEIRSLWFESPPKITQ